VTATLAASGLAPTQKAAVILAAARADIDGRLWRAALGSGDSASPAAATGEATAQSLNLASLLALIGNAAAPAPAGLTVDAVVAPATTSTTAVTGLGSNTGFATSIDAAAARTGLPAAAIAAIIDAEAAKDHHGAWRTDSHNPRSTAKGLGQFLAGTWVGEAERAGTWLNDVARAQGWLTQAGHVAAGARTALLDLRTDATASINATADFAKRNLDRLEAAGVSVGTSVVEIAHAAYLGHNLGFGDATRFLGKGLDNGRARLLLVAQVGLASADQRIAQAGDAVSAHRTWLLGFVDRHVNAAQFTV
jgi:hypothetical protein